jgi:hypothetical protein
MINDTLTVEINAKSIVGYAQREFYVIRRCKLAEWFDVLDLWDIIYCIEDNNLIFFWKG